jgi:ribosomal protein S18 acetylase RimI-like enzyme
MLSFRDPSDAKEASEFIPWILPWLSAACGRYFEWMAGRKDIAEAMLVASVARDDSELSFRHTTLLLEDGAVVGGFVALVGDELAKCGARDAVGFLQLVPREERARFLDRARSVAGHRLAVASDVFYLSKMGVMEPYRSRGYGRALVEEFVAKGHRFGLSRFALDVEGENDAARRLYARCGFRVSAETYDRDASISMIRMEGTFE